jgi:hypothetical protein
MGENGARLLAKGNTARPSGEQANPENCLQARDGLADLRWGDAENACGSRDGAGLSHCEKRSEIGDAKLTENVEGACHTKTLPRDRSSAEGAILGPRAMVHRALA